MEKSVNKKEQCAQTDVMQSVLKASDLRIGNLVYSKETNRFQKITGLTDVNPFIDAINFDYTNYNEIEPIIINEEWLLKFGFDKSIENFDYFERVKYFKYELKVGFGHITFRISEYNIIKGSTHPNIKYVHQLQNLYFALTGSELTVA